MNCADCSPEYGCFDGSQNCRKVPLPPSSGSRVFDAQNLERKLKAALEAGRAIVEAWDEDETGQIDGAFIDAMRECLHENGAHDLQREEKA